MRKPFHFSFQIKKSGIGEKSRFDSYLHHFTPIGINCASFYNLIMVAYELRWRDKTGEEHLLGILPERRKDPKRITEESVLNWGRKILGDNPDVQTIYFVVETINDNSDTETSSLSLDNMIRSMFIGMGYLSSSHRLQNFSS